VNLARLNHILIPDGFAGREQLRRTRLARVARPLVWLYARLTPRGRALVGLTVLVGALGLQVETTQVYVLFALLAGLCLAVLVAGRPYALADVAIEVTCPRRVAVGEVQRFTVALANQGAATHHAVMVEGPFLPWDGAWQGEPEVADRLLPGGSATITCGGRFSNRGEHHLDPFTAAALLPLGLSCGRRISSNPARFLVVPPLAEVVRLSLPAARRHQPGGVAQASKTGESMDLLGVRPYRPGDPIRDLHARSWARLGVPIVREYQEEYFSRVGVVVDTDRRHASPRRLEAALSLAAGIVARLSAGEALIDLLVVGEAVHPLTLGRSLGFLDQALDLLACVEPGAPLEAARLLQRLSPFLSRLSAAVFVALTWDEDRARLADALARQGVACHTIVVHGPRAPAPPGPALAVPVEAIERREPLWL
jgi:uncharacterized protein (DUF58 family)